MITLRQQSRGIFKLVVMIFTVGQTVQYPFGYSCWSFVDFMLLLLGCQQFQIFDRLLYSIDHPIIFMFLFACCTELQNSNAYELRTKANNSNNYSVMNPQDPRAQKQIGQHLQVLKVKKSDYNELVKQYRNTKTLWEDQEFAHNDSSFGEIEGVKKAEWKRLSDIIANPVLFDGRIEPQDVVQGSLGDCYLLSALSALAEKQERITAIFGDQQGAQFGIYRVTLRVNGVIQQVLVDDYVPVDKRGQPLFCQPNKNQIWVPILEKAWAKANGSYANIVAGSPAEIFRAATYAPAETVMTKGKEGVEQLWRMILESSRLDRPCCCGTDDSVTVDWGALNLVPGHAYTLVDAAELESQRGRVRMLKLRNPWGNTEWLGQGCETDNRFWNSVASSQAKTNFLKDFSVNNDGIFYINFDDYCKYFSQTHLCHMEAQGNYLYENYEPSPKRGAHWSLLAFQEGDYCIELHQGNARESQDDSSLARATLLLARNKENNKGFELVDGVLSHYKSDCSIRCRLKPGKYTVFVKFQANKQQILPSEASVSIYSLYYVLLEPADPSARQMLRECLLQHARTNKKHKFENDKLWISSKMMYLQGGYAYICFGAEQGSHHQWEVTFNESDFQRQHFKLKKPYKGKGENQIFKVGPGEEKIIIARIMNDNPKNLKFPPKLSYKIQPIP